MPEYRNITIVTEVANRELDNALLLKAELEKRGYCVSVMNKTEEIRRTPTDILITPNCYIKEDYDFYRYRFNCPSGMLVNLQYEQVLSPIEENNELYSLDPTSKEITHICWGRHTVERLTGKGVKKENLPVTGAIQLDTTRPMFDSRWKTRKEIAEEFSLDPSKKWILYISTFATMTEGLINEVQKKGHSEENVDVFAEITERSQAETISWFEKFLLSGRDSEYTIIYRPHPVELESPLVRSMKDRFPGSFRVIQDYEVKQWLRVSDIPCTWISTAIAESYFTGRNCLVFRPFPVPEDVDCVIYKGVRAAETYDEFVSQIDMYNASVEAFPIDRKLIEYYYDFSPEPAFRKIADVIDTQVPRVADTSSFDEERKKYLRAGRVRTKMAVKRIYRAWYRTTGMKLKNKRLRSKFFIEEWEKTVDNRINSEALIKAKEDVFRKIVEETE